MRKILSTIAMVALLLLPLVSQAQNVTVTLSVSDNTKGAVTVPGPGTYTLDADEDSLVVTWTANSGYIIDGIERVWTSSGYVFVDTIPWIDHSITYVSGRTALIMLAIVMSTRLSWFPTLSPSPLR